jgi:hypothetical protein
MTEPSQSREAEPRKRTKFEICARGKKKDVDRLIAYLKDDANEDLVWNFRRANSKLVVVEVWRNFDSVLPALCKLFPELQFDGTRIAFQEWKFTLDDGELTEEFEDEHGDWWGGPPGAHVRLPFDDEE